MSAIAPRDVARLCASVLDDQPFEEEQDIKGDPMGGHWGGVLQSDWDSAIHVVLELTIDQAADRNAMGLAQLMDHVMQIATRPSVQLRVLHPDFAASSPEYGDADTLRLNFLAAMVLLRRARLRSGAFAELQAIARGCWLEMCPLPVKTISPPWPPPPADARALIEATCQDLQHTKPFAQSRSSLSRASAKQRERLIQELRAFVLLAALPDMEPDTRLQRAKQGLFAQLAGIDVSDQLRCDWPSFEYFEGANVLIRHLHFLSSRALGAGNIAYDGSVQLSDALFNGIVPSGESVKRSLSTLGTVAQVKDIVGASALIGIPQCNLSSSKAETWQEFLHEARGPVGTTRGVYCHLAIATGMAVTALERYRAARPLSAEKSAELGASTAESAELFRSLRLSLGDRTTGLAFAPHAIYNEVVLRCWLLCEDLGVPNNLSGQQVLGGVRYILSCQSPNGLFQQRYRTNELDEGESTATGVCLRSLVFFARWLAGKRALGRLFDNDPGRRQELLALQRELAHSIQSGVEALVELQNDSGGFPTFAKTQREKHGLLATREGPGAQQYLLYDAPGADIVGWCLEALGELKSGAPAVPFVQIPRALQGEIDRSVAMAVGWLRRDFHPRAGWWGRYGGGYIEGTGLALRGLRVAGIPSTDPMIVRAAELLTGAQSRHGGWDQDVQGDDPTFNSQPERVAMRGDPERSQPVLTAFALMGLLDAGLDPDRAVVRRAVEHLVSSAKVKTGGWETDRALHSVMRGWYYIDQLQTRLKPVEALLCWTTAVTGLAGLGNAGAKAETSRSGATT
jgi:hypothetical protein